MATSAASKTRWIRYGFLAGMVGLIATVGIRHQLLKGAGAAPLDSFCPLGAVESLPTLFSGGGMLAKTGTSNLVLFAGLLLVTLFLGGAFCGWLCPFGAIQEWLAALSKRVFGRQLRVPESLDRYLKHMRWVVLAFIVTAAYSAGRLWFADYDPFRALFHFKFESWVAYALVGGTVVGSMLVERFWCRYLCPLGAIVGALGTIGLVKVRRSEDACTSCGMCDEACPARISVSTTPAVSDQHCTMCAECVGACPEPGAMHVSAGGASSAVRPWVVGLASAALLFALVGAAQAAGLWQAGSGCGSGGCAEESVAQPVGVQEPPACPESGASGAAAEGCAECVEE